MWGTIYQDYILHFVLTLFFLLQPHLPEKVTSLLFLSTEGRLVLYNLGSHLLTHPFLLLEEILLDSPSCCCLIAKSCPAL